MRLTTELALYGVDESADAFRDRLIRTLQVDFPGRSIDSVVCRPPDAIQYCDQIRHSLGEKLPQSVILKTLLNIRKKKSCPKGLRSPGGRQLLKSRLRELGVTISAAEFRELVSNCLADMYKNRTIDELLCHPMEAAGLCQYVRRQGCSEVLTDELILKTLLNNRKSP